MHRRTLFAIAAVFALFTHTATAATLNVPGSYGTIQAAINAAAPGDSIVVAAGTYPEALSVTQDVTIVGAGEAFVTLDGSGFTTTTNLISISGKNVTLTGFTVDGGLPHYVAWPPPKPYYGIGVSGPSTVDVHDVTVMRMGKTGVNMNGANPVTLTNVTSVDNGGAGFFATDCHNVTFSSITTSNNQWGGVGITTQGGTYPPAATSGMVFTGTNSLAEATSSASGYQGGIYTEDNTGGGAPITYSTTPFVADVTVQLADVTYTLDGDQDDALPRTRFYATQGDAVSAALQADDAPLHVIGPGHFLTTGRYVRSLADGSFYVAGGMQIQPASDAAANGDLINVSAGTFTEQVVIDGKDVTLSGSGVGSTVVASPATLATTFTTSGPNKPVITAANSAAIVIRDLTVDGLGLGNANYRIVGVGYWNAGGALLDSRVTRIIETPFSGTQQGVGILAANGSGGPYALEVGNVDVDDFQKNGMALTGTGLTVDVHDCTVTGAGYTSITAQNGIQAGSGAGGTVRDNTISGIGYTGPTYAAGGLLMISGTTIDATGTNTITDVQVPAWWQDTGGTISGIVASGQMEYGHLIYNLTSARIAGKPKLPVEASPMYEPFTARDLARSVKTVTLSSSCLDATGAPSPSVGIYGYSGGEPLVISATNMAITGWDYGVVADGAATTFDIGLSAITGSITTGYDNTLSGNSQNATLNWWGAADGPGGDGTGSGDTVVGIGGEVAFDPYLTSGASTTTCAFTPSGNEVTPNPSIPCASSGNPCVPVSFDIVRADNADLRGFSVTFTLSPELELCAGLASITEGTYLDAIGGTTFLALDNTGGSYTVDGSILGLPCGATAATGTLFDIAVQAAGGDGTGTITITDVIFRDCANGPLPAAAGAPASITLDVTPPAVSSLVAAQQKTGNTAGQDTTGIVISFTAPGDATVLEVYGAAYGNYPEYDDVPGSGSVPGIPSYPPGSPWVLTSASASPDTVHFDDRDFYYFVMFTKDSCGNVSAVSNMTDGTLNYHLGDVTDGITNGHGNNSVGTEDISALGANYGTTLAVSDSLAYLDVGPTSDYSVDALPDTDNEIEFEDLMMFAINFGQVSRVPGGPTEAPIENPQVVLIADSVSPSAGSVLDARLVLQHNGRSVKGLHTKVEYDHSRLELVSVQPGGLLDEQAAPVFFKDLPSEGGVVVDAAALGHDLTLSGSGDVATLTFRVVASGAVPTLGEVALRGRDNHTAGRPVQPGLVEAARDGSPAVAAPVPERLELMGARPNPFDSATDIVFRLPAVSTVSIVVYDVSGRLVRTLVNRSLAPGEHRATWNGRSDDGQVVGSGIYFYTFRTGGHQETRRLIHFR